MKKKDIPTEEAKRAREYLLDSKKNMERLKQGKKPRKSLKYLVKDNIGMFYFIGALILTASFIPLMIPNPTSPPIDPNKETVETMVNLVETNFTDQAGYPTNEPEVTNTSSELVILSTLTNSILLQTGYLAYETKNVDKASLILQVVENGTFRDFSNNSINIQAQYQFLGFLSLIQSWYALRYTSEAFSWSLVSSVLANILYNYYSPQRSLIHNPDTNTTNLIDQALCVTSLATYFLLTEDNYVYTIINDTMYGYNLDWIIEDLFDTMYIEFYNMTSSQFFNHFDVYTNNSYEYANVEPLMFLALGLAKASVADRYLIYFPTTGYWLHQTIIDDYVDSNWLVHANDSSDSFLNIRQQAYFSFISYLMNLKYVGVELVNATTNNYLTLGGFLENLNEQEITVEACLYGLMTLASEKWSVLELEREKPKTTTIETSSISAWISLLAIMVIVFVLRKSKIHRKRREW